MASFLALAIAFAGIVAADVSTAAAKDVSCLRALSPVAENSIPQSSAFTPAACPQTETNAFHYDRAYHVTRLSRDLRAGEIVSSFPEYGSGRILPGQTLELVTSEGAVHIERQVEALQEARPGQQLFVKSRDGQVLSVRYETTP
jgi:hypothetical protein